MYIRQSLREPQQPAVIECSCLPGVFLFIFFAQILRVQFGESRLHGQGSKLASAGLFHQASSAFSGVRKA